MYRFYTGLVLMLAVSTMACTETTNNQQPDQPVIKVQPTAKTNRVSGEYLVTLTETGNPDTLRHVFNPYGLKAIRNISKGRYFVVLEHDPGPEKIAEHVATSTGIKYVQPNFIYHGTTPK
jgi:hypothetical protein